MGAQMFGAKLALDDANPASPRGQILRGDAALAEGGIKAALFVDESRAQCLGIRAMGGRCSRIRGRG